LATLQVWAAPSAIGMVIVVMPSVTVLSSVIPPPFRARLFPLSAYSAPPVKLIDCTVRFVRSFVLERLAAPVGKTSAAVASPAGDPPFQLLASDQSPLVAPVQVCVASTRRCSRNSNCRVVAPLGRCGARERISFELVRGLANHCHFADVMLQLLSENG